MISQRLPITRPLPLFHSWALADCGEHLALLADPHVDADALAERGIGHWRCDLGDNRLDWTSGVFDLFGLPRDGEVRRADTVALYCDDSREAMERLRTHAIRHRRGFTLDAELRAGGNTQRWIRLIAAPILEGSRIVALHGTKQDVTRAYCGRRGNRIDPALL